ncbi:MAG: hypothetical protein V4592_08365 [Bacteroidota bacterium]
MQYIPFTRPDEKDFLKWAAVWRHDIFHVDQKPLTDSVVFIDTSHDLSLLADTSLKIDTVAPFRPPVKIITDRVKLGAFLALIRRHTGQYKFVLLDISLDEPGSQDALLRSAVEGMPRLLTTAHWDTEHRTVIRPVFRVPYGLVNYTPLPGSLFYKMPVFYEDTAKSLPVKLYETLTPNRITRRHGLVWLNGRLSFNYVLPEFYYRGENLNKSDDQRTVNTYYLDQLLNLGDDGFSFLKDKYIVIGNFDDDQHQTYLGGLPGCVILWDVFLTLLQSPPVITAGWLMFLFLAFWLVSFYQIFRVGRKTRGLEQKVKALPLPLVKDLIIKYVSFLGAVIAVNLVSIVFFKMYISIFYLATYLTVFGLVIEKYEAWLKKIKQVWQNLTA